MVRSVVIAVVATHTPEVWAAVHRTVHHTELAALVATAAWEVADKLQLQDADLGVLHPLNFVHWLLIVI